MRDRRFTFAALAAFIWSAPSAAIITRHDVAPTVHEAAAAGMPQPVVLLAGPRGAADMHGILIAPDWILTAAHGARRVRPGMRFEHLGETGTVAEVIVHPDYQPMTPTDVALVRLAEPLSAEPVVLASAPPAVGELIWIIGRGDRGDGLTGPVGPGTAMLAGSNRISEVGPLHLNFDFTAPDEGAEDLEAVSGGGDSGGPAFRRTEDGFELIGVSSGQDGMGLGPGRYGVVEYYMSVPAYRPWILETMGVD